MRQLSTILLFSTISVAILWEGYVELGLTGFLIALLLFITASSLLYLYADAIVLWRHNARKANPEEFPALRRLVESLAGRLDLPTPVLYLIDEPSRKAFITGRRPARSYIAVSIAIARQLRPEELGPIIVHEFGHLRKCKRGPVAIIARISRAFVDLASMALWTRSTEPNNSLRFRTPPGVDVECSTAGCGARI